MPPLLDHGTIFVSTLVSIAVLYYYLFTAQKGKLPYIRALAGLKALDEAIGRATELGKPVLFISGLADVDNIQTLAALSILSHVAYKTAQYDLPLIMPNIYSVTMVTAQEVIREAHLRAGRPDTYKPENVYYVSDEQFAFVAHTSGVMERSQPAANIYMGSFYGESLILAETGHSSGAIQIAGTAETSQLPFFVVACDYCLIGEELYAASAYLSRDPRQLGSVKSQDVARLILLGLILVGCLMETFNAHVLSKLFGG